MAKPKRLRIVDMIAAEMVRQKLTPYAIAKRAGMPAATVTRILTGQRPDPQASTLERLAEAMGAGFVLSGPVGRRKERGG